MTVTHGTDTGGRRRQYLTVVQGGAMPDSPTSWVGLITLAAVFLPSLLERRFAAREGEVDPVLRSKLHRLSRPFIAPGCNRPMRLWRGFASGVRSAHMAEPFDWYHSAASALVFQVLAVPVVRQHH